MLFFFGTAVGEKSRRERDREKRAGCSTYVFYMLVLVQKNRACFCLLVRVCSPDKKKTAFDHGAAHSLQPTSTAAAPGPTCSASSEAKWYSSLQESTSFTRGKLTVFYLDLGIIVSYEYDI